MDTQLAQAMKVDQEVQRDRRARKRRRVRASEQKKTAKKMLDRDDIGSDVATRAKDLLGEAQAILDEMDERDFQRRMSSIDPYYRDREETEMDMWEDEEGVLRTEVVPNA